MSSRLIHGDNDGTKGHLDMVVHKDYIATCGFDGEAKVFKGFKDEHPSVFLIGEVVHAVQIQGNLLYVAADDNSVQSFNIEDGSMEAVLMRFQAPPTYLTTNQKFLVAAASDFQIKLLDLDTSHITSWQAHQAPILSVTIHPQSTFLASSSCDGTLKIWKLGGSQPTCVQQHACLPQCNDTCNSTTLARLQFTQNSKHLLLASSDGVHMYDTSSWTLTHKLTTHFPIASPFSTCSISPDDKMVASSNRDGWVCVWDINKLRLLKKARHDGLGANKTIITALSWLTNDQLVCCDNSGHMTHFNLSQLTDVKVGEKVVLQGNPSQSLDDLFGDGDDDLLLSAQEGGVQEDNMPEEEEDEDAKSDGGIPGVDVDGEEEEEDEEGGGKKGGVKGVPTIRDDDEESTNDWSSKLVDLNARDDEGEVRKMKMMVQEAFQPSSCPVTLKSRFMVWNEVGRVQQLNNDEEQSITVEFHDSSTHHSMHLDNHHNQFHAASLSRQALLLASETSVSLTHFASWSPNNQWSLTTDPGELIMASCLSRSMVAVASNKRLVRMLSVGGTQLGVWCLGGDVVCMAAHEDVLAVVSHDGVGSAGEQRFSCTLMTLNGKSESSRLPLSPSSSLAWLGFSTEGSLVSVDSCGVVRMATTSHWVPICNLKQLVKGSSDNYWVISVQENPPQIRGIFCKGSQYPPTLPLPTPQILPFKMPLLESASEKSLLEEEYIRNSLLHNNMRQRRLIGGHSSQSDERTLMTSLKQLLIKQFALALKGGRDAAAVELAHFMPDLKTISLAIRYASQRGDTNVAQRLNEIAQNRSFPSQEHTPTVADTNSNHIKPAKIPMSRLQRNSRKNATSDDDNNNNNNNNNYNNNYNNNKSNKLLSESCPSQYECSEDVEFLRKKKNNVNNNKNNNVNNNKNNNVKMTTTDDDDETSYIKPCPVKVPKKPLRTGDEEKENDDDDDDEPDYQRDSKSDEEKDDDGADNDAKPNHTDAVHPVKNPFKLNTDKETSKKEFSGSSVFDNIPQKNNTNKKSFFSGMSEGEKKKRKSDDDDNDDVTKKVKSDISVKTSKKLSAFFFNTTS